MDKITDLACFRARKFAAADVDILGLGDDIGMQSDDHDVAGMYRTWLKPRLAKVIAAAKEVKPDILVSYHSCGYILPFIGDLDRSRRGYSQSRAARVHGFCRGACEVRRPAFLQRHDRHAELMPFGTPQQIKAEVHRNLQIAGPQGGLFCCPTHMLEPEVPWANIEAYVAALRQFQPRGVRVEAKHDTPVGTTACEPRYAANPLGENK